MKKTSEKIKTPPTDRQTEQSEKPFLSRFNALFLHMLLMPLAALAYYPLNRYVFLVWFGNGEPYLNSAGVTVERYFSANHMAALTGLILAILTVVLSVKKCKRIQTKWKRVLYLVVCIYATILLLFLFLEFSLWN